MLKISFLLYSDRVLKEFMSSVFFERYDHPFPFNATTAFDSNKSLLNYIISLVVPMGVDGEANLWPPHNKRLP